MGRITSFKNKLHCYNMPAPFLKTLYYRVGMMRV